MARTYKAVWRDNMNAVERAEIEKATEERDTASEHLRMISKQIKDRVIKRMIRSKGEMR